ncbi:hypothetical protein F3Y22_tig00002840pilonHSYRG00094 [Hibiscus syriacus]|uniref:ABC transporter domain-containing protein n=1 Tax=Hibiscus syriacus TaxID=106335 RepID=A0A6A3CRK4_HIBSY|nr:hypothetical protein F3Y22_tig00002840pilonHSYRG00094 [Hibiscus syriacus]
MGLGATYFVVFCCYALLLWYGGYLVRHHYTSGGLANAIMFAVMIDGLGLGQSAPSLSAFAKAKVAAAKIFSVIDHKPSIDWNRDSGLELESVTGLVELKNVDFAYPSRPNVKILNNVSLCVPSGKTIALVRSSGSGKSTMVSLIERFYDLTSGEVMLDGHDIKTLKLRWLRQQIGLIEEAARVANAHSFIVRLPETVSKLRLGREDFNSQAAEAENCYSRAMLKNPAILLLVEAPSALDCELETVVQESLDRFIIGRTTLVIAHRLSTIRKADLVAVLQEGSVSEIGTHDELIAKGENGAYAKLFQMQEAAHETAINNA